MKKQVKHVVNVVVLNLVVINREASYDEKPVRAGKLRRIVNGIIVCVPIIVSILKVMPYIIPFN